MVGGKAIKNIVDCSDEGTCSRTGKAVMVDVQKCPQCGFSKEV